ncbi:MAG: hypothetical protein KC414_12740, partial [Romboutsia sp.]|nr:hypothetical protein [Romboutsia sp.]
MITRVFMESIPQRYSRGIDFDNNRNDMLGVIASLNNQIVTTSNMGFIFEHICKCNYSNKEKKFFLSLEEEDIRDKYGIDLPEEGSEFFAANFKLDVSVSGEKMMIKPYFEIEVAEGAESLFNFLYGKMIEGFKIFSTDYNFAPGQNFTTINNKEVFSEGTTALMLFAQQGLSTKFSSALIDLEKEIVNKKINAGGHSFTAVDFAIANKHKNIIDKIFNDKENTSKNSKIDFTDNNFLHTAVRFNNIDAVLPILDEYKKVLNNAKGEERNKINTNINKNLIASFILVVEEEKVEYLERLLSVTKNSNNKAVNKIVFNAFLRSIKRYSKISDDKYKKIPIMFYPELEDNAKLMDLVLEYIKNDHVIIEDTLVEIIKATVDTEDKDHQLSTLLEHFFESYDKLICTPESISFILDKLLFADDSYKNNIKLAEVFIKLIKSYKTDDSSSNHIDVDA